MEIDYKTISGLAAWKILNSGTADSDVNSLLLCKIVEEALFRLEQLDK